MLSFDKKIPATSVINIRKIQGMEEKERMVLMKKSIHMKNTSCRLLLDTKITHNCACEIF